MNQDRKFWRPQATPNLRRLTAIASYYGGTRVNKIVSDALTAHLEFLLEEEIPRNEMSQAVIEDIEDFLQKVKKTRKD